MLETKRGIKVTLCMLILMVAGTARAQEPKYVEPSGMNNWFIELGGTGLFYSLNYEKILYKSTKWGWTGRVGFAYNPKDYTLLNKIELEKGTFITPFTTSVLYGQRKEKLELGAGFTMVSRGISDRDVIPTFILGFRVVEVNKVFFRVAYTPVIQDGKYINWYGVSLGRNFSLK